jgi:AraC-like DNA-binding protein
VPYHHDTLFTRSTVTWRRVTLLRAAPRWSEPYRVQSPRLLVPLDDCFEVELDGQRGAVACDGATALWLTPAHTYRLRRPHGGRACMVIAFAVDAWPRAGRWALDLAHARQLRAAAAWLRSGRADPLQVEDMLHRWLAQVMAPDTGPGVAHLAVERAREFIASDPARADSLAVIARAAGCSSFHLARVFRRATGRSLHAYRLQLRLTRALDRLHAGDRNLAALALDLGFSSHSHFSAVFRGAFGSTPRALRTNLTAPPLH